MTIENIEGYVTPKTDWKPDDKFNISDYNRIRKNLLVIAETLSELHGEINIHDMGKAISYSDVSSYWKVEYFNAFEKNVDILAKALEKNYGIGKTFYENGVFIDWTELNRIEGATLDMLERLDDEISALDRLEFRLGNFKGIKL